MKNIVLFTTRPITSKYTKSLIEQMSILKEYQDEGTNIIFVTPKSDERNARYIEEVAGIRIARTISYKDHYYDVVYSKKYKTWYEYLKHEFLFENLKHVDQIIVFGGLLSDSTDMIRKKNRLEKIMHTWQQMNFTSNGTYISGMLQLVKLSRECKIPFHEICYDPCENSVDLLSYKPFDYTCYHGYDWPEYNLKRLDSLQHFLLFGPKKSILFDDDEKELDLCFGFTALTKDREKQYDDVMNSLENIDMKTKIYVRHKSLGIDTFVDRDTYLSDIKKSKYTLIIPPYDLKHFSIYRFIESIYYDCLPLITKDVYINDFLVSFEIDKQICNRITVDYNEIGNRISDISEKERIEILNYFKNKCLNAEKKLEIKKKEHLI